MYTNHTILIELFYTHVSHEIGILKKYLGKRKLQKIELVVIYFSPANKLSKLPSCKHLAMTN